MEFKNIEKLTITDCCNQLGIVRDNLYNLKGSIAAANNNDNELYKRIFEGQSLSEVEAEIAKRLISLLIEDRNCFLQCKTLQEFEEYLSMWKDGGIWQNDVSIKVKLIKDEQCYLECKNSINGLVSYLHDYPNGNFSQLARKELAEKQRNNQIKRIAIIVAVIITVFMICYMNYYSSSHIQSDSNVAFSKKGGSTTCKISTDAISKNIRVYVKEEWIEANIENRALKIKVEPNHGDKREATIRLCAYTTLFGFDLWKEEFEVNVIQNLGLSTFLNVSESTYSFDKYGSGEAVCFVKTDGMNLNISSDNDWVIFNKEVVKQDDEFVVKLVITTKTNESGERIGTILVKSDKKEKTISIKQNSGLATYFDVATNNLNMDEEGTEEGTCYSISVDTDGTIWSVSEAPGWLTAKAKVQQRKLYVTLSQNTGRIKTGTITIMSNNGDSREISVKQWGDPTDFRASSSTVKFEISGGDEYVNISNNSKKTIFVSEIATWISTSVIGNSKIKISCSQNNSSPRSGSVYVTCGKEKITISINQNGWVDCPNCNGTGQVWCTNKEAQWGVNFSHQVYQIIGHKFILGMWYPNYGFVNCPICGGDGEVECPRCHGKGEILRSYY